MDSNEKMKRSGEEEMGEVVKGNEIQTLLYNGRIKSFISTQHNELQFKCKMTSFNVEQTILGWYQKEDTRWFFFLNGI